MREIALASTLLIAFNSAISFDVFVPFHNISLPPNEFGGRYIEDFFQNQLDPTAHPYFATIEHLEVSSHLLIKRNGAVLQFVQFADNA
jgi:AmpD protein